MQSNAKNVVQIIMDKYRKKTLHSKMHSENATKYMPGGDTRAISYYQPYPLFIEKGNGCYINDADGNEYIDMINNYTSLIHGHAYPAVVEAIKAQAGKGTIFGAPGEIQYIHAECLCKRIKSMDMVRYCNSGTEATLFAIRAARSFTGKDMIIKMDGGYHGGHDFAEINIFPDIETRGEPQPFKRPGVPASVLQDVLVAPYNDLESIERLLRINQKKTAAIIVEPILGAGGFIPPKQGYLKGLRGLADRYDTLLIFDEIISFRLNIGGLQLVADVTPDLTALGKIIGGGLPVGAFGGKAEIMSQFDPSTPNPLWHSGTFSGSNIVMAAGLAALKNFEQPVVERINALGDKLREGFNNAFKDSGLKGQATGFGSLVQIHWTDERFTDARGRARAIAANSDIPPLLHLEMINRGIFSAQRGTYCISTPMTNEDIEKVIREFNDAIELLKPYVTQKELHLSSES